MERYKHLFFGGMLFDVGKPLARVACLNIATKSPLPLDLVEHYSHLYGIGDGLHGML